ncbi:long-chain-fatty-acid--CoA ligase [Arsenicicoccus piscis]|uniref:Long-chain-fatty-acid--CoA ligase n=1 Tax=Arsenicicoccus piscis TaxID=673954 RepID=A0ABQ6HTV2_9MICO|nr:long-chain fatty acid--CoA ligase [Arsenicicoccus piscis]GMA21861.1 long-chain-fatty-acid--CoA ligase [Arsenicicoccus piscis]
MTNLAHNLLETARRHPDNTVVRLDEDETSYAGLVEQTANVAGWLRAKGVGPGDRVVLSLPNLPAFAVAYYAVLRLGAIVVPMNPLLKPREVEFYVRDSGAELVIGMAPDTAEGTAEAGGRFVPVTEIVEAAAGGGDITPVREVVERADDDTAVILYTSGTTGRPKGAELSHANLDINQRLTGEVLMTLTAEDTLMGCLPLFHVFGMTCVLNNAVATGAAVTLVPRFDPSAVLHAIERDRATIFVGVPTMYAAMLATARTMDPAPDLSSLRLCVSGGSSMPVEVMKAFEETFDCIVLEGYGLSETSPVASFNQPHQERKPGTIGTTIPGVDMMIMREDGSAAEVGEIGEIVIRGHNIMKGYWGRADATADAIRDGWFHSGDLGTIDDEGYLTIVDRAKDMIIRGGYNVYPREVEEVLYEHPGVAEAAVVGIPHPHYGEEVAAYVALRPDQQVSEQELVDFCKERVAAYKYPRVVHLIDGLPKGATGKILKRELPRD